MYQFVVIGLGLTLLIGGGYYLKKTDDSGVLSKAFARDSAFPTLDSVAGTYTCDINSGCAYPSEFTFLPTGKVEFIARYDDDRGEMRETGIWRFGKGGTVNVTLSKSDGKEFNRVHKLAAHTVESEQLSAFIFDSMLYPHMSEPVFSKLGE